MPDGHILTLGPLTAALRDGGLGAVTCQGVEVLRALTYPVRNRDWGTFLTQTLAEETTPTTYRRQFRDPGDAFHGTFEARLTTPATLAAEVTFTFRRAAQINRAGFTLLHPIRGVAGQPLTLHHPDGSTTATTFPARISPAQPARTLAGLAHSIDGLALHITLSGDVFEMEDQRNWSDASFKTYCRPLALPFPFAVAEGEVIRQHVTLKLTPGTASAAAPSAATTTRARLPQVLLAHEHGPCTPASPAHPAALPLLFRLTPETPDVTLTAMARHAPPAIEIVCDDLPDLHRQIARIQRAGIQPARVTALPRPFLKSHQPDGPWPTGLQPADIPPHLRRAFPAALIGGGSLTNFTELNRHRPDPAEVDFITFGNTAIVHAADDLSVRQTIEALPDIFATARTIAAGRPLHLGLFSIGMRSNPYGDATAPNPDGLRLPMAMADPRQPTAFAAAYAVAILAEAACAGVASLALAMTDGPLGPTGPLSDVLRVAHALAGAEATITAQAGHILITTDHGGLAANLTPDPAPPPKRGQPSPAPDSALVWLR
ncbi:hypothetical protein [Paragemmobacter ruber]|uniref:Uncharacterized protein n=1 Tax=Paragemmobacter ruber TaxID=1985673 RepID=A0ABW9YC19_9RHOB|nr:hypothetical protein [Rhodobacter ruber]NBE09562.1 hypothetical protein [Rhodobacter ruber]